MIAFFDLDGTLLPPPATERRLVSRLVEEGLLSPWRLARCTGAVAVQKLRGDRWAQQRNKDYLAGLRPEDVDRHARAVAADVLRRLRPEVHGHLRAHLGRGDRVVLLTGALEALAVPIGEALGVHEVCATRCATGHGRYLRRPPLRHPFQQTKASLARDIADRHGTTLAACWAYGDAGHDIPLLAAVAHPVAVHPDRALRRHATRRGWPILEEAEEPALAAARTAPGT